MHSLCRSPGAAHLFVLAVCVGSAAPLRAGVLDAGPTDRLALEFPEDAIITGVAAAGAVVPLIFADQLAPKNCRWCDGSPGTPVNSVDHWFHEQLTAALFSRTTSNTLSSVTAYVLTPAVAFSSAFLAPGPHATEGAGWRSSFIIAESLAVSEALTQAIKFTAGRQRPYAHYQNVSTGGGSSDLPTLTSDANLSFPSGHTSFASSIGVSAAMIATLQESPAAPWLWGAAGVFTVATGTLRMMSESHYFTDVLGGAALGAGCGVLFPLLHRRGSVLGGSAVPSISAGPANVKVAFSGAF